MLLHAALVAGRHREALGLAEALDVDALRKRSRSGQTALALCARYAAVADDPSASLRLAKVVVRRTEARGAASPSNSGRLPSAYGREHAAPSELVELLEAAEARDARRAACRCPLCGKPHRPRPRLRRYRERPDGEEKHGGLRAFLTSERSEMLMAPPFHQLADAKKVRKELSEGLAALDALRGFGSGWHLVDLCCGKGWASALAGITHPGVVVTAVDRLDPALLPCHFRADGSDVDYLQLDVLDGGFQDALAERIEAVRRPTAVVGVHLCGELSYAAVEAFDRNTLVHAAVLAPCCLPKRGTGAAPPAVYASGAQEEQYAAWGDHLAGRLRDAGGHVRASRPDVLSTKNIFLSATKRAGC